MTERADDIGQFVFERFSESARLVLFFARSAVSEHGGDQIGAAHLVVGILRVVPDVADLLTPDWTAKRLRAEVLTLVRATARVKETVEIPFASDTRGAITRAVGEAELADSRLVTPQHLLLALLDDTSEGVGSLLRKAGLSRASILNRRPGG